MTLEWFIFVVFLIMFIFQIINAVSSYKAYKKEINTLVLLQAKILSCENKATTNELKSKETEELNLAQIHFVTLQYEYEGKTYEKKIVMPEYLFFDCIPDAFIKIGIHKEQPDAVIIERFDKQLKNIFIKNIVFLMITAVFVVYFGYTSLVLVPMATDSQINF